MKLYQYEFGFQPHYVVAESYEDAVRTIREKYHFSSREPDRIDCLGAYVLVSSRCVADKEPST